MVSATVKRKQLIKKWPEKLVVVNKEFLPAAGIIVLGAAKRLAPVAKVKGGTLRSSLVRGGDNNFYDLRVDSVGVGTNLHYAPHVEYGHKTRSSIGPQKKKSFNIMGGFGFVPAQPYLRPALDNNRKNLIKLWKEIFGRVYGR